MSEQRETPVTLRLSNAEAEDLQGWLAQACKSGISLRQEAQALGWRLHDRLGLAIAVSPSSPVPGTPGEREEGA